MTQLKGIIRISFLFCRELSPTGGTTRLWISYWVNYFCFIQGTL